MAALLVAVDPTDKVSAEGLAYGNAVSMFHWPCELMPYGNEKTE
jgi:hypothetical protein